MQEKEDQLLKQILEDPNNKYYNKQIQEIKNNKKYSFEKFEEMDGEETVEIDQKFQEIKK